VLTWESPKEMIFEMPVRVSPPPPRADPSPRKLTAKTAPRAFTRARSDGIIGHVPAHASRSIASARRGGG
jgi:hypothetical protein